MQKLFSFIKKGIGVSGNETEINLLLLGETGVGKSTFINAFGNYFKYPTFKAAQKGELRILIPVKVDKKVYGDEDANECHTSGAAQTQFVKVYMIPVNIEGTKLKLRLIDTPGVGDPRGIDKDNENCDNILAYLATLQRLHGICFIMKANNTRFTQFFEYCFKQILTRLDKSASENIIFITTYSATSGYTAGETKTSCLDNLVAKIRSIPPHVEIPLNEDNTFALDNGGFKPLLQMKAGKTFSKHEKGGFIMSWNKSAMECFRLLTYIIGDEHRSPLKPHDVQNTTSINEVRFLIEQLANPLAEITDLIQDNIRVIDRHKLELQKGNQDVNQLKQQLYIPCIDLQVKELNQPVTVCTNAEKCAEVVRINNITKWHYTQRCHNPCYLKGIPKEVIGDPGLAGCAAMTGENCHECGCHYKVHVHIYKETEKMDVQKEDKNIKKEIKTKEDAIATTDQLVKTLDVRKREFEEEAEFISEKMAVFSYFLQENAITPYNDAYKEYIEYLIKNEKSFGRSADQEKIEKYKKLLQKHEHLQATFKKSQQQHSSSISMAIMLHPSVIKDYIKQLYNLKHMGGKIQELIDKSSTCRNKEVQKNFNCVVADTVMLSSNVMDDECAMSIGSDDEVTQSKAPEDPKVKEQTTSDLLPKEEVQQKKQDDMEDKNKYFMDMMRFFFESANFQRFREERFYEYRAPRRGDAYYDDYYEDWKFPPYRSRRQFELEGRRSSRMNQYRREDYYNDDLDPIGQDEWDRWSLSGMSSRTLRSQHGRQNEDDDRYESRRHDSSQKRKNRSRREDDDDSDRSLGTSGKNDSHYRSRRSDFSKKSSDLSRREDNGDSDHSLDDDYYHSGRRVSSSRTNYRFRRQDDDDFLNRSNSHRSRIPREFADDGSMNGHSSTVRSRLRRREHSGCRCSCRCSEHQDNQIPSDNSDTELDEFSKKRDNFNGKSSRKQTNVKEDYLEKLKTSRGRDLMVSESDNNEEVLDTVYSSDKKAKGKHPILTSKSEDEKMIEDNASNSITKLDLSYTATKKGENLNKKSSKKQPKSKIKKIASNTPDTNSYSKEELVHNPESNAKGKNTGSTSKKQPEDTNSGAKKDQKLDASVNEDHSERPTTSKKRDSRNDNSNNKDQSKISGAEGKQAV